jgi:hypothetical protein
MCTPMFNVAAFISIYYYYYYYFYYFAQWNKIRTKNFPEQGNFFTTQSLPFSF